MFEVIDQRQFHSLSQFYTLDVVYERPGYERICGYEALEHFYRSIRLVNAGTHDLVHVVSNGNAAACWGRFTGKSREGRMLNERFADVYELRNGRIAFRATHFYRAAI